MASGDMHSKRPRSKGKKGLHNKDPRVPKKTSGGPAVVAPPKKVGNNQRSQGLRLKVMPEEDLEKEFFRCTRETELHNGYQWVDGLNTDHLPFSTSVECGPGGLYFTDIQNLHHFIGGTYWVREVTPLLGKGQFARVHSEKWKSHQVMAGPRRSLNDPDTWKYLLGKAKQAGISNKELLVSMVETASNKNRYALAIALAQDLGVAATLRLCWVVKGETRYGSGSAMLGVVEALGPHISNRDLSFCKDITEKFAFERLHDRLFGIGARLRRLFRHKPLQRTSNSTTGNWLTGDFVP